METAVLHPATRRAERRPSKDPSIAVYGAVLWSALVLMTLVVEALDVTLIELVLVFAALVLVPLSYSVPLRDGGTPPRGLVAAQPAAALALAAAVFLPEGSMAAALSAPWALVCGVAALGGIGNIRARRGLHVAAFVHAAALLYLFAGSASLFVARAGLHPFGLAERSVELTSVHFHYHGFGAGLLAASLLTALGSTGPAWIRNVASAAAGCLIAAVAVVALGVTISPLVELAGVALLSVSVLALATTGLVLVVPAISDLATRALLTISALSALIAMAATLNRALAQYSGTAEETSAVVGLFALVTAFGFVFCGLWGWRTLLEPARDAPRPSP